MDHGDHGGHHMPMPRCTMNMLWNTQIEDTCIVFESWHISTKTGFVFSCIAIVFLGIFYEWLREAQKNLDRRIAARLRAQGKGKGHVAVVSAVDADGDVLEEEDLLTGVPAWKGAVQTSVPVASRVFRATLYGATVFLSFFLMLVFMTYNAYLILATVLGAAIGHYIFTPTMDVDAVLAGGSAAGKSMACH
ncbi:hypothetical protein EIP91_011243 [Steccherinum ochraceum]|uniref:Copper transport protein n=1 Tax=Steccherinum ochraceum TaxID=92696 RepID=A0A4V6N782_9APHY|nr:hypothetical protein EIP91_011243 [Steccherinum ochraceum]